MTWHSPDAVENEEELDEDTAEWQHATHDDARQRARVEGLLGDLARNLIGSHRMIDRLQTKSRHVQHQVKRSWMRHNNAITAMMYRITLL